MNKKENNIPKGYQLVLDKKLNCPLCQRPEFRGEWDEMIWCRRYPMHILKEQIEEDLKLIFQPREIHLHSTHLKLTPKDNKIIKQEEKELIEALISREKSLLNISKERESIEYCFDKGLDGVIKALASEIDELKLQGFENDPAYLRKVEEYRRLLETKYKKEGDIVEDGKVSLAVLEVRDLFNKIKQIEEEEKNGSNSNERRDSKLVKKQV